MNDFLRMMGEEVAEEAATQAVAGEMRASADAGDTGKTVAKKSLKAFFGPMGPVMALARTLPGWTFPLLGTAFAAMLKKSSFVDKLLPDDGRPAIREAKFLLKNIGPHAVIGVFTGYAQAAAQIDRKVDEARSDPYTPDDQAKKELDWVVVCEQYFPGRIFVPARAADRSIRMNGTVPLINDPDFVSYKAMWDSTHKATTRQVGGGRGQQARTENVQADPFPFELVPLSEALDRASRRGGNIAQADLAALRAMLATPQSWGAKLSRRAKNLLLALSETRARKSPLEQMTSESFFKDLPNKGDIALIEHIAEMFEGRIRADGTFSDADYEAAISHIDSFLGAELNPIERAMRAGGRMLHNRSPLSNKIKVVVGGLAISALIWNVFLWGTFLVSAVMVAKSLFAHPSVQTAITMIVLSTWMMIILFLLKVYQGLLTQVAKLFGLSKDWLTDLGRQMTAALIPIYVIAIGMFPQIAVSFFARCLILVLVCINIARGMLYKVSPVPSAAGDLTYKGAKYGWIVIASIVAVDWVIRNILLAITSGVSTGATSSWKYLVDHQWVASFVLFVVVMVVGCWIVHRLFQTRIRAGSTVLVENGHTGLMKFGVFIVAVGLAVAIPWFAGGRHEFDPLADYKKPAATSTTPAASAAFTKPSTTKATHPHRHTGQLDCAELSYEGAKAAGCP